MVECWVICLAAIHTPNGSSTVQLIMSVVYGDRQSHICGGSDHCACLTGSHMTFAPTFFHVFSRTFFLYFFSVLFSQYFISRTFSKVATFEIQRLKISVSCFSSTCRYQSLRNIHSNVTRRASP
jgi:hypothetical protein